MKAISRPVPKLLFSIGLTVTLLKLLPHLQWFNKAWYKCGQHFPGTSSGQNFDMHFESTHSIDWVLRWGFDKKAVTLTTMKISIPMQKSKMTVLAQLSVMSLVMHLKSTYSLEWLLRYQFSCKKINSLKAAILTVLMVVMVMNSESPKSNDWLLIWVFARKRP